MVGVAAGIDETNVIGFAPAAPEVQLRQVARGGEHRTPDRFAHFYARSYCACGERQRGGGDCQRGDLQDPVKPADLHAASLRMRTAISLNIPNHIPARFVSVLVLNEEPE
jgi:hypothetical protein